MSKNLGFLTTATSELIELGSIKKVGKFLSDNNSSIEKVRNHLNSNKYFQDVAHHVCGVGEKAAKKIIENRKNQIEKYNL